MGNKLVFGFLTLTLTLGGMRGVLPLAPTLNGIFGQGKLFFWQCGKFLGRFPPECLAHFGHGPEIRFRLAIPLQFLFSKVGNSPPIGPKKPLKFT